MLNPRLCGVRPRLRSSCLQKRYGKPLLCKTEPFCALANATPTMTVIFWRIIAIVHSCGGACAMTMAALSTCPRSIVKTWSWPMCWFFFVLVVAFMFFLLLIFAGYERSTLRRLAMPRAPTFSTCVSTDNFFICMSKWVVFPICWRLKMFV